MYQSHLLAITNSTHNWVEFVCSAGYNYGFEFSQQVLVHAQRPDATAVLSMRDWNDKFGRRIKSGSKAIAVLGGDNRDLIYCFDIADTVASAKAKNVPLWKVKPTHHSGIITALNERYGLDSGGDSQTLPGAILAAAVKAVGENIGEFTKDLISSSDNSFLEELDELNVNTILKTIVQSSVAAMWLSRCGFDPAVYIDEDDFRDLYNFNTPQTAIILGAATSTIGESGLREIAAVVRSVQRQPQTQQETHNPRWRLSRTEPTPKNSIRTFDTTLANDYNVVTRENSENERSESHEQSNLHERQRVSYSKSSATENAGSQSNEIRTNATEVSEKPPSRSVQRHDDGGNIEHPLDGNSTNSRADVGTHSVGTSENTGSERATQSNRYDDMGRANEQHQSVGGGTGSSRGDLQLESVDDAVENGQWTVDSYGTDNSGLQNENTPPVEENTPPVEENSQPYDDEKLSTVNSRLSTDSPSEQGGVFLADGDVSEDKEDLKQIDPADMNWDDYVKHIAKDTSNYNEPFVIIEYSENPNFNDYDRMTFAEIDLKFKEVEAELRAQREDDEFLGYYKTSGCVFYLDKPDDTELSEYHFRYDIGDYEPARSGLYNHINNFWTNAQDALNSGEYTEYTQEDIDSTINMRAILKDYAYVAETEKEEKSPLPAEVLEGAKEQLHSPEEQQENILQAEVTTSAIFMPEMQMTLGAEFSPIKEKALEGFSVPSEIVDSALVSGSSFSGGKFRIVEFFTQKHTAKEQVEFLKKEYGTGSSSVEYGGVYKTSHGAKGLTFEKDTLLPTEETHTLSWAKVAGRISELVAADRYLTDEEKTKGYPDYIAIQVQEELMWEKEKFIEKFSYRNDIETIDEDERRKTICRRISDFILLMDAYLKEKIEEHGFNELLTGDTFWRGSLKPSELITVPIEVIERILQDPVRADKLSIAFLRVGGASSGVFARSAGYSFHRELRDLYPRVLKYDIGDKVYLDENEYEISGIEETEVWFIDPKFPLENKSIPRDEFEQKAKENSNNQHLIVVDVNAKPIEFGEESDEQSPLQAEEIGEQAEKESLAPKAGDRYEIDGKIFEVTEYYRGGNFVSLEDLSAQVSVPIFRSEPLSFFVGHEPIQDEKEDKPSLQKRVQEELDKRGIVMDDFLIDEWLQDHSSLGNAEDIADVIEDALQEEETPEQIEEETEKPLPDNSQLPTETNFRITDDNLGHGGAKAKFRANMNAIKLLNGLEFDNKQPTPEQQEILSHYVGWGALQQAFDENQSGWENEFIELYTTLAPDEYESARATTLNAYYTSPTVIRAMYNALEKMGFDGGNILDPGCGTGNFQGLMPSEMAINSNVHGVELDPITGQIAQKLYPQNTISIEGFQHSQLPDNSFDLAIGNVPFGGYKLLDRRYDKHKFNIHEYFFAKSLDKLRPGGIVAFVTSKGTMDKSNSSVRKYLAQRAELLGAIRLPNNAFKENAGTEVTSDIIFLQKRERPIDFEPGQEPDWVHLGQIEDAKLPDELISVNSYFANNPNMILGSMTRDGGIKMYGNMADATCVAHEGRELAERLDAAILNLPSAVYTKAEKANELSVDKEKPPTETILADPNVRNYTYTLVDGKLYYRDNEEMLLKDGDISKKAAERIRGMIGIRNCTRKLIDYQVWDYADNEIEQQQQELNRLYDSFAKRHGRLNDDVNSRAFAADSDLPLLCALEILDEERQFKAKADMFSKRTILPPRVVTKVDTPAEALAVSMSEKAWVDLDYMSELTGLDKAQIVSELDGLIYRDSYIDKHGNLVNDSNSPTYKTASEFLSGNVREKLEWHKNILENPANEQVDPAIKNTLEHNMRALEKVQPEDLGAADIAVRLGSTWIPADVVQDFMYELLDTPGWAKDRVNVNFSKYTGGWNVSSKILDRSNIKASKTYGTLRINAYHIIERTLNMRDVKIYDTVKNGDTTTRVFNSEETAIAQSKQDDIKERFTDWIWQDQSRRERLCRIYNEKFNSTRPREYDGSHLAFPGMNPMIQLDSHQKNAIARKIYGGNTLFGHVVGAGKTFTMIAAAMEEKRLWPDKKAMFVVPNNIVPDFSADVLRLYPAANVLMVTAKDFEKKNRKKFCARIATGDYDAIILAHSQFEKIPLSIEFQRDVLDNQIYTIVGAIRQAKEEKCERYTVKQLENMKKSIEAKLEKLNTQFFKDNLIDFEQLGVNSIYIDEADLFKNLFLVTKMRNVAGIAQAESQKAMDLFLKCRYLDELTGNRGICFATGTPVSNTMAEVYTMQRYLQYDRLQEIGLEHFDAWASTFGETVTAMELAPEGKGFQMKTRFAKFFNLPELMNTFREVADIQTEDMLNLPTPKVNFHVEISKPSEMQQEMVESLAKRAEDVRSRSVKPHEDNMLLITNDGRKLALDQRIINPLLPDFEGSKVNQSVNNVFDIWGRTAEERSTQLVFCDLSTPKGDGSFNIYDDIRAKLLAKGIPAEEIAFVHEAKNEAQKKAMFAKVRSGKIRVMIGSTSKMGAGTNVQDKLIALHDLDCPWRPRDLEQRLGRIKRRGNTNAEVDVYRYITEGTFDAYLFQMLERKQRYISQIFSSKEPLRVMEEIDDSVLSYAEIKALATGDPRIMEHCNIRVEIEKLKLLKKTHFNNICQLQSDITYNYPREIAKIEDKIVGYTADIATAAANTPVDSEQFLMEVNGERITDKRRGGTAILEACRALRKVESPTLIGKYRGLEMSLMFNSYYKKFNITLQGKLRHELELGNDIFGNITRIDNMIDSFATSLRSYERHLPQVKAQLETAKEQTEIPFSKEAELTEKQERYSQLTMELKIDKEDKIILDEPPVEVKNKPVPVSRSAMSAGAR